jgi:hypothetical protein
MGLKTLSKFLLLMLASCIACIYIFISSPIRLSKQMKIKTPGGNLYFLMSNKNNWKLEAEARTQPVPVSISNSLKIVIQGIFIRSAHFQ